MKKSLKERFAELKRRHTVNRLVKAQKKFNRQSYITLCNENEIWLSKGIVLLSEAVGENIVYLKIDDPDYSMIQVFDYQGIQFFQYGPPKIRLD